MIDHEYTDEIVCPHCGHEHRDSWEVSKNQDGAEDERECEQCGGKFKWLCDVRVTYTTEKV